uniref:Uncharacterized protein n=1 Tax=Magallana gigas TaxID=29159 RepID=A0A8W8K8P5_MAGGI
MKRTKEKVRKLQEKVNVYQRKEQQEKDNKFDKGVQCNTLNTYIEELKCEIDNLIAEKDDIVADEDDYVHLIFTYSRRPQKEMECLCSDTKKKISKIKREERKTGGGKLPANCFVTPVEDKIQSIIGETAISGIDGIDTLVVDKEQRRGGLIITEAPAAEELPESPANSSLNDTPTSSSIIHTSTFISAKKRKIDKTPSLELNEVEKERLEIEKNRLEDEKKRLHIEEQRLVIEQTRLQLEQEKHSIKLCQLGIISNATITSQQ